MGQRRDAEYCDLNAIAPELSESLLAWWEVHGRKDPALKPWMFKADGLWPDPDDLLDPYGVLVAEVTQHSAASHSWSTSYLSRSLLRHRWCGCSLLQRVGDKISWPESTAVILGGCG